MDSARIVTLVLSSSVVTLFLSWLLYRQKHKATASGIEKDNDSKEIKNQSQLIEEWREFGLKWKALADEQQEQLIENSKAFTSKLEELSLELAQSNIKLAESQSELAKSKSDLAETNKKLTKAYQRIAELEKQTQ